MSFIGQGQDGQVITASGDAAKWIQPVASSGAATEPNDSNSIIASQIFTP